MWNYDHFSASINITQIRLVPMCFDSTGGATMLVSNYEASVSRDNAVALAEYNL